MRYSRVHNLIPRPHAVHSDRERERRAREPFGAEFLGSRTAAAAAVIVKNPYPRGHGQCTSSLEEFGARCGATDTSSTGVVVYNILIRARRESKIGCALLISMESVDSNNKNLPTRKMLDYVEEPPCGA